jgi:sigma-B regulation protein RsbU (phosphoserine phosphatase)
MSIALVQTLTEAQVRAALRHDALNVTLAILFVAVGLAAVSIFRLRRQARPPELLWFGLFALLFGMRLLILTDTVRFTTGLSDRAWFYAAAALSAIVPLPALLFLQEIFPQWKRLLTWALRAQVLLGVAAIVSDQVVGRPDSLRLLNSLWVLALFLTLTVALFRQSGMHSSVQALRIGALTFSCAVVLRNLSNLAPLQYRFDFEPIGFAVFLAALARVVISRTVEREEKLVAINKELEVARQIQASILPRGVPSLPQVQVSAHYRPMTAVAGDFYDFLPMDARRLGILVADVSGHGVPAALIASMVKVAISAQQQHADDPGAVLAGINQTLCGKLDGRYYVTAAYLFLDLDARHIRYGAAGHPPLLWLHPRDGVVDAVVENGMVLGLFPEAPYTYVERPLDGASRFVLYTDGLTEARNEAGEEFGDAQLQSALSAGAALDANQIASSLLDNLGRWAGYDAGRHQEDDVTLIVVDV